MDRPPATSFQGSQEGGYGNDLRETERLAMGISEMVLKSPTEKTSKKLSINAAEFVPSWMKNEVVETSPPASAVANSNCSDTSETNFLAEGSPNQYPADISFCLLADIQMYVAHLQSSPASFGDDAMSILDLLINFAYNDELLTAVVDKIFLAGLELDNFAYQCARLCAYLVSNYWGFGGAHQPEGSQPPSKTFKTILIERCFREHQIRLAGPLPFIYNYGILLAELYNQLKVGDDVNWDVLAEAVLQVVDALLSQPNNGNVAGAVSILKCCGATLERSEAVAAQAPNPDAIFAKFEHLLQSETNEWGLSEDGKTLIKNLLKSRADWKQYGAPVGDGYQQQQGQFPPVSSDMVYFGPDGEPLTAEEAAFLERELGALQSSSSGDEEAPLAGMLGLEDDIDDAYEEFLKMTEEKIKQNILTP